MKRILIFIAVLFVLAGLLLFVAGSMRYGGPDALLMRVRAEFMPSQPVDHPPLVPTPLPTPTPGRVVEALQPTSIPTEPPPSPTPTPRLSTEASVPPTELPAAVTSTPPPIPSYQPAGEQAELAGLTHYWQTWNNCGPATLAMQLSYFGSTVNQEAVRQALRPNREDKNVSPPELAEFARSQGYNALVRVNGDPGRLKLFISNGIPVLIETWLVPEPNDGMGHYRLLTGYDDESQMWIAYDSFISTGVDPNQPYRGIRLPYAEVDRFWPVFNHTHVLIYTDEQAELVESILGEDADAAAMWQRALAKAEANVSEVPEDAFAWFNLGADLAALGRFEEAVKAYDRARVLGLPWRMMWYQFGPFQAYYKVGRYDEVLALANATLATTTHVEELHYWRGLALYTANDVSAAREALARALKLNPNYRNAAAALESIQNQ